MTPFISVTMCLYNSMRFIDETIASLLSQTWKNFEAILVDDGSTDGTAEHIRRRYPDSRLKLIRQSNGGMGHARSVSVAHAQGEYVAFLDHDDLWLPHKLERQVAGALENRDAALLFSDCLLIDLNGNPLDRMSNRFPYDQIDLRAGYAHDELLMRGCFISMSTAMVRRSELQKCGGPDPILKFGDDYVMWLRLSRTNPVIYIAETLAKWRLHKESITERHPEISVRSHTRIWGAVARNHTYPPRLRITVSDHLFGQQRCAIRFLLRKGRLIPALKIAAEAFREWTPFLRFVKDRTRPTPIGKALLLARFIALRGTQISWNCFLRGKDFVWSIPKRIHGEYHPLQETVNAKNHVWVDGTPLSSMQVGYFNFVCETVRMLALDPRGYVVHVMVSPGGEAVLRERLSHDSLKLQCHPAGAGFLHDRQLPHAVIHFIKRFWRRCMHLRRASSEISATEILIWHGRFQFESSRKIAVIHDMTARLMPLSSHPRKRG